MHSEPCQHLGLPQAYTTQGIPKAQSHKSQLRGCAVCMPSVNSTTSLCSKPELARLKKTCLLRGLHSACGWGAWNVAYTLLRGGKMQSVFSQVGNSGVWNNCCGSLCTQVSWEGVGSWSTLPLGASMSQAGSGRWGVEPSLIPSEW